MRAVAAASPWRALAVAPRPRPRRAWAQFSEVRERLSHLGAGADATSTATRPAGVLAHFPPLSDTASLSTPLLRSLNAHRTSSSSDSGASLPSAPPSSGDLFAARDETALLAEESALHDVLFPMRSDVSEATYGEVLARVSPQTTEEWSRHLASCRLMNDPYTLVKRFHRGLIAGLRPSAGVLQLVMDACLHLNQREMTMEILQMYGKFGLAPDTAAYNILLFWACRYRDVALGRTLYDRMRKEGVAPDAHTFNLLLLQSSVSGDVQLTERYFQDAVKANVKADTFRYEFWPLHAHVSFAFISVCLCLCHGHNFFPLPLPLRFPYTHPGIHALLMFMLALATLSARCAHLTRCSSTRSSLAPTRL